MTENTQPLTQVEWTADDFTIGNRIAEALGYSQYAYTSTSGFWGLFCLPENPQRAKPWEPTRHACIIKTREMGFLIVQTCDDLQLNDDGTPTGPTCKGDRRFDLRFDRKGGAR